MLLIPKFISLAFIFTVKTKQVFQVYNYIKSAPVKFFMNSKLFINGPCRKALLCTLSFHYETLLRNETS